MAQDLSIENPDLVFFSTIKTIGARLWFINNQELHERILAYLACYQEVYGVIIYGFIIMGNHFHLIACFPNKNKAAFFRDFNSMIARLTATYVEEFHEGRLWARRVRSIPIGTTEDIKDSFFYAALNPVSSGLGQKLKEFSGYNSFTDAIFDRRRKFKIIDWEDYNNRKRGNSRLALGECTKECTLVYTRLPGFEEMTKAEYIAHMTTELEQRCAATIGKRTAEGKGFATREILLKQRPGAKPRATKKSQRDTKRPLILTKCVETKRAYLDWYFSLLAGFKEASRRFRLGDLQISFPTGTYRPPTFCLH